MTPFDPMHPAVVADPNSGCWLWSRSVSKHGYGQISRRDGRSSLVHRVAWELNFGQRLTPDICVCHKCDTPACVNPAHMFLGTRADNMQDMTRKGRRVLPVWRRGVEHHAAKLNDERVAEIRRQAGNLTQRQLAAMFGISQAHVGRIIRGLNWHAIERRAADLGIALEPVAAEEAA